MQPITDSAHVLAHGGACKECTCTGYTSSELRGRCEGKRDDGTTTCGHRQNQHE